jgi:phospholipid/cholesterol/gamma-HCH transport system substrate-binding protein
VRLTRWTRIQLTIFAIATVITALIIVFGYLRLPTMLFGAGHYKVTVELPEAAGLYRQGNVTYRGTEVGRVDDVRLTRTGVEAVLSLRSEVSIPSDIEAQVHSQTAIGEQYVALLPRNAKSPPLRNGDVIPVGHTTVPPDINSLLDATNTALLAIPNDNLKTVIDESYTAFGGLGPELGRIVKGSTALAIDARKTLDPLTALIDRAQPVLDSQTQSSDAVTAWAAHLASITGQLQNQDSALAGVLDHGATATAEGRHLIERLQPALPILLANLVSINAVAITYQPDLEQLLVLLPQATAALQATLVPSLNTKQDIKGGNLSFNMNLNLPPPCTTGYLPAQQRRDASLEDYPDRPTGDLYCRIPQDSPLNVRGMRNIPCETVPGKRAPTVKMCESNEQYVPLNNGFNWKGDPNATLSGQDIPQRVPGAPGSTAPPPGPAPPPIPSAQYDPATGSYLGPDGKVYTQSDLGRRAQNRTWQSMLLPPDK